MENNFILENLVKRYRNLVPLEEAIKVAVEAIVNSYQNGGKTLICGNGGSSSDADHIVGELMKSFETKRPLKNDLKKKLVELSGERGAWLAENLQQGLPTISLSAHTALLTAIANDIDGESIFAQQVVGFGRQGDVLLGISSSGNSKNVVNALIVAKAKGLITVGLTGKTGGEMKEFCDILINVPEQRTLFVQELHVPIYHTLCLMVEQYYYKK